MMDSESHPDEQLGAFIHLERETFKNCLSFLMTRALFEDYRIELRQLRQMSTTEREKLLQKYSAHLEKLLHNIFHQRNATFTARTLTAAPPMVAAFYLDGVLELNDFMNSLWLTHCSVDNCQDELCYAEPCTQEVIEGLVMFELHCRIGIATRL